MRRLQVVINAQLRPGSGHGGVETVLRVLTGLAGLDGPEQYRFVALHGEQEWLRSLVRGTDASVVAPPPSLASRVRRFIRSSEWTEAPSNGRYFDRLGTDVVHFPYQRFHPTAAPSIFNPHDLQHRHYPAFFSAEQLASRESIYGPACRAAQTVAVASKFVKDDVVANYAIDPAKIRVIPWAPLPVQAAPMQSDEELRQPFALYPAVLWEHKNHSRLLDAVALLRDTKGLIVNLVCTGFKTDYWSVLERQVRALRLAGQVAFPGVVSDDALAALYRSAQFVIIPSLFEAASAPMLEAWQHGTPVACAANASLPEQAAGAALLFDPTSVADITSALEQMATDAPLRDALRSSGARRLQELDPTVTLKRYRAIYRQAAGLTLNEEDRWLLAGT